MKFADVWLIADELYQPCRRNAPNALLILRHMGISFHIYYIRVLDFRTKIFSQKRQTKLANSPGLG